MLSGCAQLPPHSHSIRFNTQSPRWLDDLNVPVNSQGKGIVIYPVKETDRQFPAVIILHSSLGIGSLERDYAEMFLNKGIAVLLVDSFTGRGVQKITEDQTVVSEASILADLFKAYKVIEDDKNIDATRVAVLGFSKGGLPALYSSFREILQFYGYDKDPFSAHVSFYPWCGVELRDKILSGPPIQIHVGSEDNVTPLALCQELVGSLRLANPHVSLKLFSYSGQGHAFNHPYLKRLPSLPVSYKIPRNCYIRETHEGTFIERNSGRIVTSENFSQVIDSCSEKGGWVSGSQQASELSQRRVMSFLEQVLFTRTKNQ